MKKKFALLLAASMMFSSLGGISAYAEEAPDAAAVTRSADDVEGINTKKEALIIFDKGQPVLSDNITVNYDGGYSVEKVGGEWALKRAGSSQYVFVNTDNEFLYAPDGTPVEIEVEYYDTGEGYFALCYDGVSSKYWWDTAPSAWAMGDIVKMTDSKEWKKHTFYVEDMCAMGRYSGRDFNLQIWTHTNGLSTGDVYIRSIKVKKVLSQKPITTEAYSEFTGNHFGPDEDKKIKVDFESILEQEYKTDAEYTVCDYAGNVVKTGSFSFDNAPEQKYTHEFDLNDIKRFDVYKINIHLKSVIPYDGEEFVREQDIPVGFSVINKTDAKSAGNRRSYVNTHAGHGYNAKLTSDIISYAGFGGVRDAINWFAVETTRGNYHYSQNWTDYYNYITDDNKGFMWVATYAPQFYWDGTEPSDGITRWPHSVPYGSNLPEGYADYCENVLKTFPKITYLEYWNEPDGFEAESNWKKTAENYVKMTKAAYERIKSIRTDIPVIGMDTAQVKLDWMRNILEAGGYDYMDMVSFHPYDWSGSSYDLNAQIGYSRNTEKLFDEFGGKKPIAVTELGATTEGTPCYEPIYSAGVTIKTLSLQAQENLCEVQCWYDLQDDGATKGNKEHGFGLIESSSEPDQGMRWTAKPSYVAMAGVNKFLADAEPVKMIHENGLWLCDFEYSNGKNVAVVWSDSGSEQNVAFSLGTSNVDIYDMYTNHMGTMESDDGVHTIQVSENPIYIKGDFATFEASESSVGLSEVVINASTNDKKTIAVSGKSGGARTIVTDGAQNVTTAIDAAGNLEIIIDGAEVSEKVMKIAFYEDGKMFYYAQPTLIVKNQVAVEMTTGQYDTNDSSHWQARFTIMNVSSTEAVSGTCIVTAIDGEESGIKPIRFEDLKPGQTITLYANLPQILKRRNMTISAQIDMDNGYTEKIEKIVDFTNAVYAKTKPVIDGELSSGEWLGDWLCSDTKSRVKNISGWGGKEDLSLDFKLMYDEENFYIGALVSDDVHSCNQEPGQLWAGDSLQIGIENLVNQGKVHFGMEATGSVDFNEITIALTDDGIERMYMHSSQGNTHSVGEMTNFEAKITRRNGKTVYEIAIPWTELFGEDYVLDKNTVFGYSMLVNDNDGKGRRGWIEYNSGIGNGKNSTLFGKMKLEY